MGPGHPTAETEARREARSRKFTKGCETMNFMDFTSAARPGPLVE